MQPHHQTRRVAGHGTHEHYFTGYVLAMLLTLAAFAAVVFHTLPTGMVTIVLICTAIAQVFVHMWFFLHMFRRDTPFWNTVAFTFTATVIALLVGGSMFILITADFNMMPGPPPQ